MSIKKKNALILVLGNILSFLRQRLGVFGPFSFKLVLGLAFGLASLLFFAKLSEDLLSNELLMFDQIATGVIRFYSSDQVTSAMKTVSSLGSPLTLIVVGIVVMIYTGLVRKHIWDTLLVPITLVGGIILNEALKLLFHRARPELPHLVKVTGLSFPSGHSMMSFIFYGLIIYLLWLNFTHKFFRVLLTILLVILILAIGISRIYLGVHYPSDVLAGFAAGSFWLVACIFGLRGVRYYKAHQ
ncbi:MAG: phosphatase PAP2 family protein [Firmicutes bacterium]|nr:phosphatase PAP2 family protein [Bacillota bacterium]